MKKQTIPVQISGLVLAVFMMSCGYFTSKKPAKYVARVNDVYLYETELQQAIPEEITGQDSLVFAHNYIKDWATKQLLLQGAERNLPNKKINSFETMVRDYRQELYIEAYKDMIMTRQMDTAISDTAIKAYYARNELNFKLNEDLVKLRYLKLSKDYPDLDEIKEAFKRFNEEDQGLLADNAWRFKAHSLNDSVWVRLESLYHRIPLLKEDPKNEILKKENFIQLSDSLSLYLIFIKKVRSRDEKAPLSYVKPILRQIILNKRKLKFEKEFEKEITKDALDANTFEIYN